jgi:hypothetical protein
MYRREKFKRPNLALAKITNPTKMYLINSVLVYYYSSL